jgi:hypothetical protein
MQPYSSRDETQGIGRRLRQLPGQLMLSVINATALLVIAACVLTLMTFSHVENSVSRLSAVVVSAIFERVEFDAAKLAHRLHEAEQQIRDIRAAVKERVGAEDGPIGPRIEALTDGISGLRSDVAKLTTVKAQMTDQAFRTLGAALTEGIVGLRQCGTAVESTAVSDADRAARAP